MSRATYDEMIRAFFDAQPRWLINDVSFVQMIDGEEPVMCLSLEAEKAFLRWAVDTGRLRHPERVKRFRILLGMEELPADFQ